MTEQEEPQARITAVCPAEGCEDWCWRGPEQPGRLVVDAHEQSHRSGVRPPSAGAVTVITDIPGESDRDRAGRIVREVWVQDAEERGDTRSSHLAPYSEVDEVNRLVDQRIGLAIAADARARAAEAARSQPQVAYVARLEEYDGTSLLGVFADQDQAAAWLTRWHEANDHPGCNWETTAWPAAYVPAGGVEPDPADPAPERTARELAWELETASEAAHSDPEAGS